MQRAQPLWDFPGRDLYYFYIYTDIFFIFLYVGYIKMFLLRVSVAFACYLLTVFADNTSLMLGKNPTSNCIFVPCESNHATFCFRVSVAFLLYCDCVVLMLVLFPLNFIFG